MKVSSNNSQSGHSQDSKVAFDMLKEWLSLAESQMCSTEVLSEQLPKVNELLATSMENISGRFSNIAADFRNLEEIVSHMENCEDKVCSKEDFAKMHDIMDEISKEISGVVVGMQFQDRVSQNILITVNIMSQIAKHVDKEISSTLPSISKEERKGLLDKDFAIKLLEEFRLGELQNSFIEHLIDNGYINNASDLGFGDKEDRTNSDDDVELF